MDELVDRYHTPLGTWLKIASAEPVEIMAFAGFDFVVLGDDLSMPAEAARSLAAAFRAQVAR